MVKNKTPWNETTVSFNKRSLNMDDYLASIYYDPKRSGGFGSIESNQRMVDETRCVHSP